MTIKVRCSDCNQEIDSSAVEAHAEDCEQRGRDQREREIFNLVAGPELDVLIAGLFMDGLQGSYSTSEAAAHQLIKRLLLPKKADGFGGGLNEPTVSICYHASGKAYVSVNPGGILAEKSAYGPLPLALCQAAIMAEENVGRAVEYHARRYSPRHER